MRANAELVATTSPAASTLALRRPGRYPQHASNLWLSCLIRRRRETEVLDYCIHVVGGENDQRCPATGPITS